MRRPTGPVAALVLALVAGALLATGAAAASGEHAGPVTVVNEAGSTARRTHGGSRTTFSLRLPEGASCPGDSANDGYRVQSFLVPVRDDPAVLRYKSIGPEGDNRYALYDVETHPYVQMFTTEAESPGKPGYLVNLPTFDYAVFPPGYLTDGPHRIGVACTLYNETVRYWDAEVVLSRDTGDARAQLQWHVVGTSSSSGSSSRPGGALAVVTAGVAAAVVAVVAVLFARRRRSPRPLATLSEER